MKDMHYETHIQTIIAYNATSLGLMVNKTTVIALSKVPTLSGAVAITLDKAFLKK